jgi:hypothetical protein
MAWPKYFFSHHDARCYPLPLPYFYLRTFVSRERIFVVCLVYLDEAIRSPILFCVTFNFF